MRLLEYEAKKILKNYGIPIPTGKLVSLVELPPNNFPLMLKAQIPSGGRGKSGGVLEAVNKDDFEEKINQLFVIDIKGYRAKKILVEEKINVVQEYYMGITYDTMSKGPLAIFSPRGGIDIEDLAATHPESVKKGIFSTKSGFPQYRAREIISKTGISGKQLLKLSVVFANLAKLFLDYDATIAEINPLSLDSDGRLIALDCHIEIEDEALFRHKDLADTEADKSRFEGGKQSTPFESKAEEIDKLDHRGVAGRVIEFDGNLGLIIGGGGASLTVFDAIQYYGGRPSNYCEVGGNPTVKKVKEITKHILTKPGVDKIAVIMNVVNNTRVDLMARGVVKGVLEAGKNPSEAITVFRVPGAWEEEGFKILSRYNVKFCDRHVSIDAAAKIAVEKLGN